MLKASAVKEKPEKHFSFMLLVALCALCNVNRRRKQTVSRHVVAGCVSVCVCEYMCACVCVCKAHVISHTSSDYRVTMCAQNKISIFAFLSLSQVLLLLLGVCVYVWVLVCVCECVYVCVL